jgi:type IV pilus assembly protein PilV
MVEVLVSVVVLSVGILGNAALYFTALQAKSTALSRMQAVNLVNDMADRIRANHTAGLAYKIAPTTTAPLPQVNCVATSTGQSAVCTAAEMAAADLYLWSTAVGSALSGKATRSIAVDTSTAPPTYTIMIIWPATAAGTSNLRHVLRVQI